MAKTIPIPTEIKYHQSSRLLDIAFDNGTNFELSAEYLRVYSPSAEVRGHAPGEEVLQIGKADVAIERIEPIGTYAVQFFFDDNHDTGIYSWEWLYYLGKNKDKLWTEYLERMEKAGAKRAPDS